MPQGVVVFFDPQGYGVISQDSSEQKFPFYGTDIVVGEDEEPSFPHPTTKVQFEVEEQDGQKLAVKIKFIN
ncbi:hypothetical protein BDV38DRAFT_252299 [Aspergillus pseudotamarii]|uniref:CSD domain-containing protein n=1 Tax=Aspergillus pseudotamarii TaxID=132259 RepID=A0A5N6SNZ8_ASPPS|nr:uncharacterized protein BDV38DRAFT_252299 [Aspergillus pseudotamarii]KAE8135441.1 hypothetical protein BDV38DRAFT_252299 [Aspergillus pseudotamarii]